MQPLESLAGLFRARKLTRARIIFALAIALAADGLQFPLAVPPAPEIIDVVAMILTVCLLGFHLLLLPTFVVEFIPVVDMLPTWTGCVAAVIALRKREERKDFGNSLPVVETPPPVQLPRQIGNAGADQVNAPK